MTSQHRSTQAHREGRQDMITNPVAQRTAREVNRRTRVLESAASRPTGARWAQVAGWLLVLLAVAVTVAQANLVGHTPSGRWNSARDETLAVLLGLGGLRLAVALGRQPLAVGIALLAGVGLVANGLIVDHATASLAVLEVLFGCLAVLCSLAAWVSPMRQPRG